VPFRYRFQNLGQIGHKTYGACADARSDEGGFRHSEMSGDLGKMEMVARPDQITPAIEYLVGRKSYALNLHDVPQKLPRRET
jgi:hypothetical protein